MDGNIEPVFCGHTNPPLLKSTLSYPKDEARGRMGLGPKWHKVARVGVIFFYETYGLFRPGVITAS